MAVIMARFRQNMSIRPVHRIKHVVDIQAGAALGVRSIQTIVSTVDAPVLANVTEVETGAKINGFYLKVEAYATTAGALSNAYMVVFKNTGNNLVDVTPNQIGASDNKRFVIHQEMVMLQKQVAGNPRTLFAGVIVIPKGMRRCGPQDQWKVIFLTPGVDADFCIECIYKEFR